MIEVFTGTKTRLRFDCNVFRKCLFSLTVFFEMTGSCIEHLVYSQKTARILNYLFLCTKMQIERDVEEKVMIQVQVILQSTLLKCVLGSKR